MKKNIIAFILLFAFVASSYSQNPVLKDVTGWKIDSIAKGLIWYKYTGKYKSANQAINVLEVDVQRPEYKLEIKFVAPSDSLSHVATTAGAMVGINGTYELDASFIRANGVIRSQVSRDVQKTTHLRHWKHEGAFFYDNQTKAVDIQYGTNDDYFRSSCPNVISAAPVLISDYSPVGETFIGDVTGINLNSLEYEDYRRHQGVRHPRTAIACMEDGKILLITVDGRTAAAEGINAKDLTQFLTYYFNPKHVLNLDGGGSTCMYIKGKGGYKNNDIVNCPIDSDVPYKQRIVSSFILIHKEEFSSINNPSKDKDVLKISAQERNIQLKSDEIIEQVKLHTLQGQELYNIFPRSNFISFPVPYQGFFIVSAFCGSQWHVSKLAI